MGVLRLECTKCKKPYLWFTGVPFSALCPDCEEMKFDVDKIKSIKPRLAPGREAFQQVDAALTYDDARSLFYKIWDEFEISEWIEAEGYELVEIPAGSEPESK